MKRIVPDYSSTVQILKLRSMASAFRKRKHGRGDLTHHSTIRLSSPVQNEISKRIGESTIRAVDGQFFIVGTVAEGIKSSVVFT